MAEIADYLAFLRLHSAKRDRGWVSGGNAYPWAPPPNRAAGLGTPSGALPAPLPVR